MSNDLRNIDQSRLRVILTDLCKIILTDKEKISESDMNRFFDSINGEDISLLNRVSKQLETERNSPLVRFTVQSCIMDYIQNYQDIESDEGKRYLKSPFDFDSSDGFEEFKESFGREYQSRNNGAAVPMVFNTVFNCIQRISEQYRFFEQFYIIRSQQTKDSILEKTRGIVELTAKKYAKEEVASSVKNATEAIAEEATKQATEQAGQAKLLAEQAVMSAKRAGEAATNAAKKAVEDAVGQKMTEVSTKVSETTVTVLGIFSAIVLTVVGSFIYTSSVIGSAGSVNYFKLVSMTSLVGLVCFDLLILMFHYIFRIRGKETKVTKNWIVILANILLSLVMIISGILYFTVNDPHDPEKTDSAPTESTTQAQTELQTEASTIFNSNTDDMHESTEQLQVTENQQ